MKVLQNESLKKYTTVRIGGMAKTMYVPENTHELVEILKKETNVRILGGGRIFSLMKKNSIM